MKSAFPDPVYMQLHRERLIYSRNYNIGCSSHPQHHWTTYRGAHHTIEKLQRPTLLNTARSPPDHSAREERKRARPARAREQKRSSTPKLNHHRLPPKRLYYISTDTTPIVLSRPPSRHCMPRSTKVEKEANGRQPSSCGHMDGSTRFDSWRGGNRSGWNSREGREALCPGSGNRSLPPVCLS
jgi:hypothetical protein